MRSPLERDFEKVVRYCGRWGVPVRFEKAPKRDDGQFWFEGPIHGAIQWKHPVPTIWWEHKTGEPVYTGWPCALLHELSHCLDQVSPDHADEQGQMLAFEWWSVRYLGIRGWSEWMHDFGINTNGYLSWSESSTQTRGRLLAASLDQAIKAGILDKQGRPTFIRTKRPA